MGRRRPRAWSSRSSSSLRRFPRPVSASVRASWREPASICMFSPNVIARRAITARIAADESTRESGLTGPEVVVDEHGEREQAAADRREEHRPALEAGMDRLLGRLPRRPGEQHAAADPAEVGRATGDVRAGGRLEQVEAVADREDEQTGGDQTPGPADSPAGDGEHPDHERDRRQVGERIGEIRRDRGLRAARGLEHRLEDDGGADCRHGQAGDDPVEPDAAPDGAGTRAQQQEQSRRRRARTPQARTRRRATGRAAPPGRRRQTSRSCSRRPTRRRRPHQDPGGALARARDATRDANGPGNEHEPVVEPVDDEMLQRGVDVERERERANDEGARDQGQRGSRAPTLWKKPHGIAIGLDPPARSHPGGVPRSSEH